MGRAWARAHRGRNRDRCHGGLRRGAGSRWSGTRFSVSVRRRRFAVRWVSGRADAQLKKWSAFLTANDVVARLAFAVMAAKLAADIAERIVWTFSKRFHPGILVELFSQRQFLKRLSARLLSAPHARLRLGTCSLGACTPLLASASTNSKRFWRRVWQPSSRKARGRTIRSTPSPWRSHIGRAGLRLANCCISQ